MNDMTTERPANQVAAFRHQLDGMSDQFKAALPVHIPVERFTRVVMTAVQQTPELMTCERRSLWNAAVKAAQDGLLPDGREGAMVIYKDKDRGSIVQWMPMIAGIRKKVRNSGEIATWDVQVVHENDEFDYELGDEPFIKHKPTLGDPGKVIAAYSVCTLKTGEKSREVMSVAAIEKVRAVSRAKDSKFGPWVNWYDEMCRKTVARRHSKALPMSTDLDDLIRRDDALYDFDGAKAEAQAQAERPKSLAGKLDMLASGPAAPAHDADTGEIIDDPGGNRRPADGEGGKAAEPSATAASSSEAQPEAKGGGVVEGLVTAPRALTADERKKLRLFADALASVNTPAAIDKGASRFWSDNGIDDESAPLALAANEIVKAHLARTRGDISIADADQAVRKVLPI